jgi:hypothetical protein
MANKKYAKMTMEWTDPRQFLNTVATLTINMSALEKVEAGALEVPIRTGKTKTKTVTAAEVPDDPNSTTHIAEEIINRAEAQEEAEKKAKKEAKGTEGDNGDKAPAAEVTAQVPDEECPFGDGKATKTITHDDVKKLLGEKVKSGKKAEAAEVFKSYDVKKLSEFEEAYPEPEKLAELYQKLEEL